MIGDYIDEHREEFGVEPICGVLQIAPSTYYAAKRREVAHRRARAIRDAAMMVVVGREPQGVWGRQALAATRRSCCHIAVPQSRCSGPVARGDEQPDSDLDLLVELGPGARPLRRAVDRCGSGGVAGVPVDVGTPESLRAYIRELPVEAI